MNKTLILAVTLFGIFQGILASEPSSKLRKVEVAQEMPSNDAVPLPDLPDDILQEIVSSADIQTIYKLMLANKTVRAFILFSARRDAILKSLSRRFQIHTLTVAFLLGIHTVAQWEKDTPDFPHRNKLLHFVFHQTLDFMLVHGQESVPELFKNDIFAFARLHDYGLQPHAVLQISDSLFIAHIDTALIGLSADGSLNKNFGSDGYYLISNNKKFDSFAFFQPTQQIYLVLKDSQGKSSIEILTNDGILDQKQTESLTQYIVSLAHDEFPVQEENPYHYIEYIGINQHSIFFLAITPSDAYYISHDLDKKPFLMRLSNDILEPLICDALIDQETVYVLQSVLEDINNINSPSIDCIVAFDKKTGETLYNFGDDGMYEILENPENISFAGAQRYHEAQLFLGMINNAPYLITLNLNNTLNMLPLKELHTQEHLEATNEDQVIAIDENTEDYDLNEENINE